MSGFDNLPLESPLFRGPRYNVEFRRYRKVTKDRWHRLK
jgi:hypothetical protein